MSARPTDHSQLDLADLHLRVVRGQAHGMVIWQPRIGCWLSDKRFAGQPLPEPYDDMQPDDIFRSLGCSARLYRHFNPCLTRREDERVVVAEETRDNGEIHTRVETPLGAQTWIRRRHPSNPYAEWVKYPIASPDEMRVAAWRAVHSVVGWDEAHYRRSLAQAGDLGAPTLYLPRVNVQDLFINTMGVSAGSLALLEYPQATIEEYFEALDDLHMRMIDVVNDSPIEIVNFGDNLHCATLPPMWFEQYVLPAYRRRCERLHRAGKFVHSHWDGDTKSLLPYARETGLDGIEAITPKPQGDVTLEEVRQALGDEMFLIDGIPAVLFDHTYSEDELADCTRRLIDLFAPRLILGISDEISSTGDIERIRLVGRIVDDYNAALA